MKKIIIITIILILLISIIPIYLFLQPMVEMKLIENKIDKANYCNVDSDCVDLGAKCPFGCNVVVNKDQKESISMILDKYYTQCIYSCMRMDSITCENNKCIQNYDLSGENNCNTLKESFDEYSLRSELPIIEDNNSLCHGMNMGTDFSNLKPKWAVAKLIEIDPNSFIFRGKNETMRFFMSNSDNLSIGTDYRIDMNNYCRSFFMMADSRSESPILKTFVALEEVSCSS